MKYVLAAMRIGAWLALVLLAMASLTPGDEIIRSGLPGKIEHVIAYFMATAAWMLAYPRLSLAGVAGLLIAYGGILEVGQIFVPGRTAQPSDFMASGAGVLLGLLAGIRARFLLRRISVPTEDA